MKIKIKKLRQNAKIPTKGSRFSAGYDLYACIDDEIEIEPFQIKKIPTGLSVEIPEGFAGFIFARSGLATKHGLAPANKVGVCDSDYRGEYVVALKNSSTTKVTIKPNDRIAQLIVMPVEDVCFVLSENLEPTERGCCGFGSTGI